MISYRLPSFTSPDALINYAVVKIQGVLPQFLAQQGLLLNPQDPQSSLALKVASAYNERVEFRPLSFVGQSEANLFARVDVDISSGKMKIKFIKKEDITANDLENRVDHLFVMPIIRRDI
jgi:hypothetical protein